MNDQLHLYHFISGPNTDGDAFFSMEFVIVLSKIEFIFKNKFILRHPSLRLATLTAKFF